MLYKFLHEFYLEGTSDLAMYNQQLDIHHMPFRTKGRLLMIGVYGFGPWWNMASESIPEAKVCFPSVF